MKSLSALAQVLLLSLVLLCNNECAMAFIHDTPTHHRSKLIVSMFSSGNDSASEYTATEVREMDSLILSLSLEPTDKSRRHRLATVFAEELTKEDCKRFADLFDQVLAIVGDRVQAKAKKKALLMQQQSNEPDEVEEEGKDEADSDGNEKDDDGGFMGMGKSPEERQLWALVDMMVQSKTLSKKAFGELGNKGMMQ